MERFSEKKILNIKCLFWFSVQLLSETFLILRRIQRDIIINIRTSVFIWNSRYSCQILIKLELPRQIFENSLGIKFNDNPSSGSRFVPWGRTDRQDKANCEKQLKILERKEELHNLYSTPNFTWVDETKKRETGKAYTAGEKYAEYTQSCRCNSVINNRWYGISRIYAKNMYINAAYGNKLMAVKCQIYMTETYALYGQNIQT